MSDIPRSIPPVAADPAISNAPPVDFPAVTAPRSTPLSIRVWSIFALACAGTLLGIGHSLTPDPSGVNTHLQLHLEQCSMLKFTGYPCPTCGCTTAVTYFAHFQPINSFLTQPFGFTVGALAFITVILCSIGAITGRWFGPSAFHLNWYWRRYLYSGLAIVLAGWAYKALIIRMNLHPV